MLLSIHVSVCEGEYFIWKVRTYNESFCEWSYVLKWCQFSGPTTRESETITSGSRYWSGQLQHHPGWSCRPPAVLLLKSNALYATQNVLIPPKLACCLRCGRGQHAIANGRVRLNCQLASVRGKGRGLHLVFCFRQCGVLGQPWHVPYSVPAKCQFWLLPWYQDILLLMKRWRQINTRPLKKACVYNQGDYCPSTEAIHVESSACSISSFLNC